MSESLRARFSLQNFCAGVALAVPFLLIIGRGAADAAMAFVSLAFLYTAFGKKDFTAFKSGWFIAAIAAFAYMAVAGIAADFDKGEAVLSALKDMRFPVFALAFSTWILPNHNVRRILLPWMMALLGLVAIDTIVQFIFGTSLSGHVRPDYAGRLTGPFTRLVVGVYLERLAWPIIGLFFAWAIVQPLTFKRLAGPVAFTLLIGAAVLVSGERMSLMLFGLCGLMFAVGAKNLRLPLLGCGLAVALFVASAVFLHPVLKDRFVTSTLPYLMNLSQSPYGSVWHNGLTAWKHSPVFGVGRDNFVPACEVLGREGGFINEHEEKPGPLRCVRHPHSVYIEWMAEGGLIGLAFFLIMIGSIIGQGVRNILIKNQTLEEYYIRLGYLIGLVPFLWPFMSSMSFFTNWSAVLFWWVTGLVLHPTSAVQKSAIDK